VSAAKPMQIKIPLAFCALPADSRPPQFT